MLHLLRKTTRCMKVRLYTCVKLSSLGRRVSRPTSPTTSHWAAKKQNWSTPLVTISAPFTVKRDVSTANLDDYAEDLSISPNKSASLIYATSGLSNTMSEKMSSSEFNETRTEGCNKMEISDILKERIGKRSSRFFYGLPFEKRVILLRRTENITVASTELGQNLADELGLPIESVSSWLSRKRYKNLRIVRNPKLTEKKMSLLRELFEVSSYVDDDLALLLAYELELPVDIIHDWFQRENLKAKKSNLLISNEEEEEPASEVTPEEISLLSDNEDDDRSCSPISELTDDSEPEENIKFVFSEKVSARISRYKNKFFYGLPFSKQIVLLKNSRYLTICQVKLAKKLAERLKLPYENVFGWLIRKRYKNLRLLESTKITEEHEPLLEDEFQLSPKLTDERALMLSYELLLPTDKIYDWFERRINSIV